MIDKARAIYSVMQTMDVLEALPRTGYLLRGVRNAENVAAHSFQTAMLAMLLADAEGGVDKEKVLRMALLHEAGETLLTDLPLTAKKYLRSDQVDQAELAAAADALSFLDDPKPYLSLVEEYQQGRTTEAKLVRAADKLQMLCKVRFYEKAGATNLDEFFEKDQGMDLESLPVAKALLELLQSLSGK